jgi:hypothetical protein
MKRVLVVSLLFIFSFLVRVFFWIFGFSSYLNWVIYDVGFYVDSGRELITSLINGNDQVIRSLIFHPLLGFYTTGLFSISLSGLIDKYSAGLLPPILFSSLMCLVVFLIGERIGGFKMGFIAWLLASFDPYSIQFSVAFLDMPATFFSTLFMYLLIKYVPSTNWKRFVLLGIIAGLAFSSKHIVIPLVGLLILLNVKKIKKCLIIVTVAMISYLLVNFPKLLSLENVKFMLHANVGGGGIGMPAIIYGPIEIGKLYTYPWYILTYLGLGYTGVGVAPYLLPVIGFILLCYQRLSKKDIVNSEVYAMLVEWCAVSLLPLIFLPRNYWIPLSKFPGMNIESDVLVKFFFPYYYAITIPSVTTLVTYLMVKTYVNYSYPLGCKNVLAQKIFEFIITIFLVLSPLALAANIIYPFWDFMFTLIINIEKQLLEIKGMAIYSLIICLSILITSTYFTLYLNKKRNKIM